MSANVMWRPVKNGTDVPGGGFMVSLLQKAFNCELPVRLRSDDAEKLRLIARVSDHNQGALDDLADAIDKHGEIEVWAEY